MSNQVSNLTRKKNKVWIIFQGEKGKEIVDSFSGKFHKFGNKYDTHFHLTSFHPDTTEASIYSRVQQDAVECDAAIAIIADDDRHASVAGNLWFEIGLWLAQKPASRLIICKKGNVNLEEKHEQLISDIHGKPAPSFIDNEKIWTHIFEFVINLNPQNCNLSIPYSKVNDIFNRNGSPMWISKETYHCGSNNNEVCGFREQSLEFSAELLRMGKVNHERELLALIISKIACFSGVFRSVIENPNVPENQFAEHLAQTSRNKMHQETLNKLSDALDEVKEFGNDLIRASEHYPKNYKPLDRVSEFLTFRIETCLELFEEIKLIKNISESKDEIESLFTCEIKNFIEFVKKYGGNQYLFKKEVQKTEVFYLIQDINTNCELMAKLLNALGNIYFNKCSKILKDGFEQMNEPKIFSTRIKQIISDLPHNDPNEKHQSIWHESIISSKGAVK